MSVQVSVPAKINLSLGVGPLRDDGFHALATVYQAVGLYDHVVVSKADDVTVAVTGERVDIAEVPTDDTNIAVRAALLLAAHHGIERGVDIAIDKGIPVAGGMAGGSADAAATLVGLDRLWDLRTTDDDLLALAAELGSDVPFALLGGSAHGLGRGELVEPVADPGSYWWVVVPSDAGLSTPAVYGEYDRLGPAERAHGSAAMLAALEAGDTDAVGASLRNDLQAPAFSLRPELAARMRLVAERVGGAVMLSGSGPTLVAASPDQDAAREARATLLEAGLPVVHVATGPVAGAHVVEYV